MSAKDRGIWLLEQDGNAMYWRMPGGFRIVPTAMHSTMASVVEPHLPFRRMAPIRRKDNA